MVVMTRQAAGGGFLVCIPSALTGACRIFARDTDVIGFHTRVEVPGVRLTKTTMESIGEFG